MLDNPYTKGNPSKFSHLDLQIDVRDFEALSGERLIERGFMGVRGDGGSGVLNCALNLVDYVRQAEGVSGSGHDGRFFQRIALQSWLKLGTLLGNYMVTRDLSPLGFALFLLQVFAERFEISVVVIRLGMPDDGFESSRDLVTPPDAVAVIG